MLLVCLTPGGIPPSIGKCKKVVALDLAGNGFDGEAVTLACTDWKRLLAVDAPPCLHLFAGLGSMVFLLSRPAV